ncbi:MAG: ATP-binding cassette domain-containing protein [Bacteroidaceae bacterium]|nr:ATP-binding cassette domain-containing protein [Bacteroidaceae bacterium]
MVIKIENGVPRHPLWRMAEPVNLEINRGEQIAIVGDNAAGKSRLVEILTGHYPLLQNEVQYDFSPSASRLVSDNLKYISFRDSYGDQDGTYYYQQRWNQHDIADDMPTVAQLLNVESEERRVKSEESALHSAPDTYFYSSLLSLNSSLSKRIISLSSGELRKFQMAKALATNPRVLILDNPFIGLDAGTRKDFRGLLETLTRETDLLVILVLSKRDDIPDFITHVLPVEGLRLLPKMTLAAYREQYAAMPRPRLNNDIKRWIADLPVRNLSEKDFYPKDGGEILRFRNVSIRYGEHTILKPLNWTVHEGERWALSGPNGSGKSTLLSLVCADNPQAYACDIELFGHRRGTGESIWEIKRHIGYVSPEMHRAYLKDIPAIDVVASGLHDSVGLYVRPRPEQKQTCLDWMHVFGIDALADRSFLQLSSGEQRLCLLARAFVKDPELLILDEPLHGLDDRNRSLVRQIVKLFCQRPHKTLVFVTHYEEELPDCITHRLHLPGK